MASTVVRALTCLFLLCGASFAVEAPSTNKPYPPKLGEAHPPLALWNLEHSDHLSVTHFRGKKVLIIYFASWSKECREMLPAWYETLHDAVESGDLVLLGVAVEQHPDRARLFAQWKKLNGAMMQDPVNYMRLEKLPLIVGIDENGYVRVVDPDLKTVRKRFLARKYPGEPALIPENTEEPPNTLVTRRYAREAESPGFYIEHGDAVAIAGLSPVFAEAIEAYGKAIASDRRLADAYFGLGVVHRMRFESEHREPGDFQAAVDVWARAAKLAPTNEIYQRRIQSYAPPMESPYPLFDWVATARKEIAATGDTPVALSVEPMGAELGDASGRRGDAPPTPSDKDDGSAHEDKARRVQIEQTIVESLEKDRSHIRQVHLSFVLDPDRSARWGQESKPLRVWLRKPAGAEVSQRYFECAGSSAADDDLPRTICFTVSLAEGARKNVTIRGHAIYQLVDGGEASEPLRQDFEIKLRR